MSELAGDYYNSPEAKITRDNEVSTPPDGKVKTDVPNVFADGERNGLPLFKVSKNEFYQNMSSGRQRLRFKTGTAAGSYMRNTKYNRPFWIENQEDGYIRKIK